MINDLESSLLTPPGSLRLRDAVSVLLKLSGAAGFGQVYFTELFDRPERDEIEALTSTTRRQDKVAGKVAAKIVAQAVTRHWFGAEFPLSLFQVLSPDAPAKVAMPTHPRLDAMLSELNFSISHSGDIVAAVASRRKVGIDIELISRLTPETMQYIAPESLYGALSQYVMPAASCQSGASAEQVAAVTVFTRKEAVLKAAGIGLGEGLDDVDLTPVCLDVVQQATHRKVGYEVVSVLYHTHAISLACVDEPSLPLPDRIPEIITAFPTVGQEALYMLEHLKGIGSAFALAWQERLLGQFDVAAARQALQYMVNRHDSLRWHFGEDNGHINACVSGVATTQPAVIDLTRLPRHDAYERLKELSEELLERRFDLDAGPLFHHMIVLVSDAETFLLANFHHSIMDAYSALLFRHEFATAYNAFTSGRKPLLPALPFQFSDYTRKQRELMTFERLERLQQYWQHAMAGCQPSLPTGASRNAQTERPYDSRHIGFEIDTSLRIKLANTAKSQGVTQFVIALAAFQLLLRESNGEENFAVGIPCAGRETSEEFAVMGYFVNVLPIRAEFGVSTTVDQLLQRLREAVMGAFEHQDLPLAELAKILNPDGGGSAHRPVFQSVFRLLHEDYIGTELTGLQQQFSDLTPHASLYDLNLLVNLTATEGRGCLEYRSASFNHEVAATIVSRYLELLLMIAEHPEKDLKDLAKKQDHPHMLTHDSWNDTKRPIPKQTVEELFAIQARQTPDAIAVEWQDGMLTYTELDAQANRLANHLISQGIQPGEFVGVSMEPSPDLLTALLAILKAGCAYVPLDPKYPPERLGFMSRDADLSLIISLSAFAESLSTTGARLLFLDREQALISQCDDTISDYSLQQSDPAYVMYTSGSTGNPRGVVVPHTGIIRLLFNVDYVQLDADQLILQLAPTGFDASTFEIWGALLHGGRCVIYPNMAPTVSNLGKWLRQHRITTLFLTTSLFNLLIDEQPEIFQGVQQLLFGGEKACVSHVRQAAQALPDTRLINCYGPTEATTFSTAYTVPKTFNKTTQSVPIGKPISNTTIYLLDEAQAPVAAGKVGEIYIGGMGLASGYLEYPELTARKFIDAPPALQTEGRLYRTGDLARQLPDGNLEFISRIDNQIKVRGYRIEPEEIEDLLNQHSAIKESAVVPKSTKDSVCLVAFVAFRLNYTVTISELRQYMKSKLPSYMIPDLIIELPDLPHIESYKIDRQTLKRIPVKVDKALQGYNTPRDATDAFLLDIWEELLGRQLGIDDDFFEHGGNSLNVISLLARIERHTGRSLPPSMLFSRSTVRALAESLILKTENEPDSEIIELHKGRGGLPLFFLHGDFTGGGFFSKELANTADLDGPFLALQPYGLTVDQALPDSIVSMAALHLRSVRERQPSGPYRLAGYCNGALIAFEMAQQLLQVGEQVEFLGLIDPSLPFRYAHKVYIREPAERFVGSYAKSDELKQVLFKDTERRWRVINHYSALCADFVASPYPGRATLILIEQSNAWQSQEQTWQQITDDIDLYRLSTDMIGHGIVLQQHSKWLGLILRQALDKREA